MKRKQGLSGDKTDYAHVDASTMSFVKSQEWFDDIVTDNMFGDIITDLGFTASWVGDLVAQSV